MYRMSTINVIFPVSQISSNTCSLYNRTAGGDPVHEILQQVTFDQHTNQPVSVCLLLCINHLNRFTLHFLLNDVTAISKPLPWHSELVA